jgi:DNA transformation protein
MTFLKPSAIAHDLTDLANISFVLAEQLGRAGIKAPEQLRSMGAKAAWRALQQQGFRPSIQALLALEGAVQDCRWSELAASERLALIRFASQHGT